MNQSSRKFTDILARQVRRPATRPLLAIALLVATCFATHARGQSIQWNWDGVAPKHWSIATNWNPIDVPDALNETATIGGDSPRTVELNISPTIQHLLITNPEATLDLWGSRTLTTTEWNGVTNYGTVLGDSGSFLVGVFINHGTYISPGAINSIAGPITNEAASPEGILIHGPSSLELYGPIVTNNGTIHINDNAYLGLSPTHLHLKAPTLFDGTGEIIMDRFAQLSADPGVVLTQGPDHTIRGTGNISAILINDGVVRADDPVNWLTLDTNPKTNNGTIVADADCRLDIFGTFEILQDEDGLILADDGLVNLRSMSTVTPLTINGGSLGTLNDGVIRTGSSDTVLRDVTLTGLLEVDFGTAILVAGDGLTNNGTIHVDPAAVPSFTHFVFIEDSELSGLGELILGRGWYARLFVNDGVVGTNGDGHTIRGNGVMRGEFVNNGTIAPGESIGLIETFSPTTITQGPTGVIDVEIAGTGQSEYDRMTGSAEYVLDGTLRVSVVSPYVPQIGHSYTIMSGSSVSGAFAVIEGDLPGPELDWDVTYNATNVVLSVVPCALSIDVQPLSQTVCRGAQVTLSVTADNADSYQWQFGGVDIEGATGSTYFIPFALPEDTGFYDVVITNHCNEVTAGATLFVHPGGSGDVNGDGAFDGRDIQAFSEALIGNMPVNAGYCAADITADGDVDQDDVHPFLYTLLFE